MNPIGMRCAAEACGAEIAAANASALSRQMNVVVRTR
jgi:hypothetical protein